MNDTKLTMFFEDQLDDVKKAVRDDDLDFATTRLHLLFRLLKLRRSHELRTQLNLLHENE